MALHAHACENPSLLVSDASKYNANAGLVVYRHEQVEQNNALSVLFVPGPDQSQSICRFAALVSTSSFKAFAVDNLLSFSDDTFGHKSRPLCILY